MASVLLAVSSAASPVAQDQTLQSVLTTAGHTVTLQDSTANLPTTGYDVVVVTESGSASSQANTDIPTCPLPVVHMETNWTTTRMASVNATNPASSTQLDVIATTHAIVAGLSDPITHASPGIGSYGVSSSNLASGVVNVAESAATAGHCQVAAAEAGATLTTGTAPARRVEFGIGIGGTSVSRWTADANTLFVQAVEWAAGLGGASQGSASGGVALAGTATGTRASSGSATGSVALSGSAAGSNGPAQGAASGTVALAGTATGVQTPDGGVATGSVALAGSATGARGSRGSTSGALVLAGTATGQEASLIYRFEPPTYETEPSQQVTGGPRYKLTRSLSVVRVSGIFTEIKSPDHDTLKAAGIEGEDYFLGGRIYEVDYDTRLELEAAGYTTSRI